MGTTQPRGLLPRPSLLAAERIAELPVGFGLKPLSTRTRTRLCVSALIPRQARSHFGVRALVASLPFGRRNTTRRLSFTCRLLDRGIGRWLRARTLYLCAAALARKARTDLHYPLPLAANDVGITGCTTTCSFADLRSRTRPVHESRYFRASFHRYPRQYRGHGRPDLPGVTEFKDSAGHHGSCPFPAVADG